MRRILKHIAMNLAQRLGYTIVPNWRFERFHNANFLRRLFSLLEIDCVIDVGANRGQYRQFLRQEVEFQGHIISFEPIPDYLALLNELAMRDPKWIVNGYALGARAGRSAFNIMTNTEFSSFRDPTHDVVENFRGQNDVREKVLVDVKTLDQIVPELRKTTGAKNIYLKLDTQGFDLEVLKGAANSLRSVRALQTEASIREIYDGMPRYDEVIRFLEDRDFVMSGIFPNNAGHFPLLIEFDCYMVNKAFVRGSVAR